MCNSSFARSRELTRLDGTEIGHRQLSLSLPDCVIADTVCAPPWCSHSTLSSQDITLELLLYLALLSLECGHAEGSSILSVPNHAEPGTWKGPVAVWWVNGWMQPILVGIRNKWRIGPTLGPASPSLASARQRRDLLFLFTELAVVQQLFQSGGGEQMRKAVVQGSLCALEHRLTQTSYPCH
jgi:hypothetical protein